MDLSQWHHQQNGELRRRRADAQRVGLDVIRSPSVSADAVPYPTCLIEMTTGRILADDLQTLDAIDAALATYAAAASGQAH